MFQKLIFGTKEIFLVKYLAKNCHKLIVITN
jgi:hypothetical protein